MQQAIEGRQKEECLHLITQQMSRTANLRRVLASKYREDSRTIRAAQQLGDRPLADHATALVFLHCLRTERRKLMTLSARYRAKASELSRRACEERNDVECERLLRMAGYWIVSAQNEEWLVAHSLIAAAAPGRS